VAICTNKPEALAIQLMQALDASAYFDALVGADTLAQRKPDPAPLWEAVDRAGGDRTRVCLIGDTVTDRSTAANANIPSVLVTFGPGGGIWRPWRLQLCCITLTICPTSWLS
jgi:phosphoglycolate phosphatase